MGIKVGDKTKKYFKKLGWAGVIFFTVKGIISSILIYYFGMEIGEIIKSWFK